MSDKPRDSAHPIAVVGIGCLFPKAQGLKEFWANIKSRVDGITEIPATHWSPEDYFAQDPKRPDMTYARRGGFLSPVEFDAAEFGISPNALEATDSAQLLGLVAAQMALRDAGYGPEKEYDRNQVSVILGVTGTLELVVPLGARLGHPVWRKALKEHGIEGAAAESIVESIKDGYVPWQESSFPGLLGNVVAGRIANRFNFGGTNCVVDAACASSLSAAHLASLELSAGRSRMVVTGGVDCFNDIFMYMCFSKTPALSPTGDAKPFDKKADGTILGEGLGMVVLKRLEDAEADGDRIYAVLKGVGSSSDGRGKSIYAPSAEGQTKALEKAYAVSGVSADTVELVEAHGTGTTVGDGVEVDALKSVYRKAQAEGQWCALGSVKSMIGHTKAAAGAAGLIKASLSLYHKVLPPTIKAEEPIPQLENSPFYLNTEKRPWLRRGHPRRAAVSALGFGGSNFHAVLEEHRAEKPGADWDGRTQLVALSGKDSQEILAKLDAWAKPMSWDDVRLAAQLSRSAFNPADQARLCFVLGDSDLPKIVQSMRSALAKGARSWSLPDGAYFDSGTRGGKLAVLFAGQGAQYAGMGRDLACQFPEALGALAEADAAFSGPERLSDLIYPRPAFTPQAKADQETALRSTDCAQPALGAVELGMLRLLETFGLSAGAFAGHSYGELCALTAAGRLSAEQLHSLSGLRGRLMKKGDGGRGGMLAVQAPLAEIEKIVSEEKLELVVANKNSPLQSVLSGRKEEIERAAAALKARGLKAVALPVSAAFHSPLVACAVPEFRAALEACAFQPSPAPVYSNKTAQPYPSAASSCRDLLASQLESPVEFTAMVRRLLADGFDRFVELGPGARLTGLVSSILEGRPFEAAALDSSNGKRSGVADLARLLAQLSSWGQPLRLDLWDGGQASVAELASKKKPRMGVALTGANHRSSKPASRQIVAPAAAPAAPQPGFPVSDALRATQDSLVALQLLQEQTAALHQKFLENQLAAHQSFEALVDQQRRLLSGQPSVAPASPLPRPLPVVAAVSVAAPAPAAPAQMTAAPVEQALLAVVAEKTGYPVETLNMDMDLESDLGIDSIKRVEIMSAVQQRLPEAPKVKPEHLGTLRTLRKIVEFLSEGAPRQAAQPEAATAAAAPEPAAQGGEGAIERTLLAVVAEKTGYPVETLNRDMDLESDLGIDSIKRVEILSAINEKLPGAPKAKPEHLGTLKTLRHIVDFLSAGRPAAVFAPALAESLPARPLAPSSQSAPLTRLVLKEAALPEGGRGTVSIAPGAPIVVASADAALSGALVARLKELGHDARGAAVADPLPEKLSGLVIVGSSRRLDAGALWEAAAEAAAREAFSLACRAARPLQAAAKAGGAVFMTVSRLDGLFGLSGLRSEQDPLSGALAGLAKTAGKEWEGAACKAVDAAELPVEALAGLLAEELFLDGPQEVGLSAQGKRVLVLEDRPVEASSQPPFQPGDLVVVTGGARGVTAEAALALAQACRPTLALWGRSALPAAEPPESAACADEASLKRHFAARGLKPKEIGERCRRILADREICANIARLEAAGSRVLYQAVDVRDEKAVARALQEAQSQAGPARGLVHGAGVLADKRLEDKTAEQFDAVWATKVSALRHILAALDLSRLKAVALFSSSTARYGRLGQGDYAMANEALNKIAQLLSRRLPQARVASLGWGPWDGGMVTAPLKALFEAEGVGVIGLEAGGRLLVSEMAQSSRGVELVVLGGEPKAAPLTAVLERSVSLEEWPFLSSHVINGRAVVPMAVLAELLAHAALHAQPGMAFHGLDGLRVYKGVVLVAGQVKTLRAFAGKPIKKDGGLSVPVELRGEGDAVHAGASVVLVSRLPAAPAAGPAPVGRRPGSAPEQLYGRALFHGPEMRFVRSVPALDEQGVAVDAQAALPPKQWLRRPWRDRWLADPAALDAAFQAMILWTTERMGAPSLPSFAARYRQFAAFPAAGSTVVCRVTGSAEGQARADMEFLDAAGRLIARLDGYECTVDASLRAAFRRDAVEEGAAL